MREVYSKLLSLGKKGEWSLEKISALLDATGNPQRQFKAIIVGGTNGKGSITAMVAAILKEAGFKVGAYYSPHVDFFGERIQVDGERISDEDVERVYALLEPHIGEIGDVSIFEAATAIAFHKFAEEMVDYAVLEVGMGGRLDATNAADAIVSVVATVDLEHTQMLGDTVEKIAWEKAGILRPKGTLVTMEEKPEALKILQKECAGKRAEMRRVGADARIEKVRCTDSENVWRITTRKGAYEAKLRLLGEHQGRNAACAVLAAEALKEDAIGKGEIERGLARAFIPARLEVVSRKPLVIMDAAHNPAAMAVLAKSLKLFKYGRMILVTGMMGDKDIAGNMKAIAPLAKKVIINKPKLKRAAEPEAVAKEARKYCEDVEIIADVAESKRKALSIAGENDLVLFAGSIYMLGEARGTDVLVDS